MYSVNYFPVTEIHKIKKEWLRLQTGRDMTYFQQYDWYEVLAQLNESTRSQYFEILFAKITKDEQAILIAPLWIIKRSFRKFNRKGGYIFGKNLWADYLNFIYDEFDAQALELLLADIKTRYNIIRFSFDEVREDSHLYQYITKVYGNCSCERTTCVELTIPDSIEEYHHMLSKNARQNIRTAFNRARTDGLNLEFNYDDHEINIEEFVRYRNIRLQRKIVRNNDWRWKLRNFISTKILGRGYYQFPAYSPYIHNSKSHFLTCKTSKGELCAAFCYGIDNNKTVVLMAAATNPLFQKYSPGILSIYSFVLKQIEVKDYKKVDFTRGNEKYKTILGGVPHFNYKIDFTI